MLSFIIQYRYNLFKQILTFSEGCVFARHHFDVAQLAGPAGAASAAVLGSFL